MMKSRFSRRVVLTRFFAVLGGVIAFGKVNAATSTPKSTEGPFYPELSMRFDDVDNDLVKIEGRVNEAGGEILHLSGVVSDSSGEPCPDLRVEIWQCDMNGKYLHTGDDREVVHDTGFQGFGFDITDETGLYGFRTIVPARYPGRTPHIHVKILKAGKEILTTQFYIEDHSDNSADSLYRRMSREQASLVSMNFTSGGTGLEATVNVVV